MSLMFKKSYQKTDMQNFFDSKIYGKVRSISSDGLCEISWTVWKEHMMCSSRNVKSFFYEMTWQSTLSKERWDVQWCLSNIKREMSP